MDIKEVPRVRLTSYGKGEASIAGLTAAELETFQGALNGHRWVRVVDGRLESAPAYEAPPAPTEDPVLPHWRRSQSEVGSPTYQVQLFEPVAMWQNQFASITIQHLCGHDYTPEKYKVHAEFLEASGFACLRSRRHENGQYWEIWFLPGLWAAQGPLKEALLGVSKENEMKAAIACLTDRASFGTLDLAYQRLAQVLD